MLVSLSKSSFSKHNTPVNIFLLPSIQGGLLEFGFTYLSFHLKPNYYSIEDWKWHLKHIDQHISNCYYRWSFIGGWVTLVKSVLESILVYWLSFSKATKNSLRKMRTFMFYFLWVGEKQKNGIHLVTWEIILQPKRSGD